MFEIIRSIISAGGYKLADIRSKAIKLYAIGELTGEQLDELLALASAGVSTDAERPEILNMLQSLGERISALEVRLAALEGGETAPDTGEYPAWKPWDGISADYQQGAIVSHNGQLWVSQHPGQNVWEPGAPGTEELWVAYDG